MKTISFLIAALVLVVPLTASNGDAIGTIPAPASPTAPPGKKAEKVRAGEKHTNGDGVTVSTDADSGGYATVDPKDGNGESETTVVLRTGFRGKVCGLDFTDTVNVRSNSKAEIESSEGGNVNLSGGSTVTVTNTAHDGGRPINVTMPGGGSVEVPPGSSATFRT